jgi:hypothetical protein
MSDTSLSRRYLFSSAWRDARAAHARWGGSLKGHFVAALQVAWRDWHDQAGIATVHALFAQYDQLTPAERDAKRRNAAAFLQAQQEWRKDRRYQMSLAARHDMALPIHALVRHETPSSIPVSPLSGAFGMTRQLGHISWQNAQNTVVGVDVIAMHGDRRRRVRLFFAQSVIRDGRVSVAQWDQAIQRAQRNLSKEWVIQGGAWSSVPSSA